MIFEFFFYDVLFFPDKLEDVFYLKKKQTQFYLFLDY